VRVVGELKCRVGVMQRETSLWFGTQARGGKRATHGVEGSPLEGRDGA
jgi:hypothetical protein